MRRNFAPIAVAVLAPAVTGAAQAAHAKQRVSATVKVTITDRALRVTPTNPQSGATRFLVVNQGKKLHVFSIAGPGVKGTRTGKIAPGKSATLTVTLKPGAYVLSDPVGLGTYTSAFLDVYKASSMTGSGGSNSVHPDVDPPPMCGVYLNP